MAPCQMPVRDPGHESGATFARFATMTRHDTEQAGFCRDMHSLGYGQSLEPEPESEPVVATAAAAGPEYLLGR